MLENLVKNLTMVRNLVLAICRSGNDTQSQYARRIKCKHFLRSNTEPYWFTLEIIIIVRQITEHYFNRGSLLVTFSFNLSASHFVYLYKHNKY